MEVSSPPPREVSSPPPREVSSPPPREVSMQYIVWVHKPSSFVGTQDSISRQEGSTDTSVQVPRVDSSSSLFSIPDLEIGKSEKVSQHIEISPDHPATNATKTPDSEVRILHTLLVCITYPLPLICRVKQSYYRDRFLIDSLPLRPMSRINFSNSTTQ